MNFKALLALRKAGLFAVILIGVQLLSLFSKAQMRQIYSDDQSANAIVKISLYTPSEGYIAFTDWIGFTTDSGRTFVKKNITISNVDYNGYAVNLTFGFGISGVKAFDRNTIIAYGDYGLVPAILYSSDGGNTFKLIFHSQYNQLQLSTGITDMIFPQNDNIGFAIDADRILKTTDKGATWTAIRNDPGSFFDYLEAVDDNTVFAFSTGDHTNKLLKTENSGAIWQSTPLPDGPLNYAFFSSSVKGWLNVSATSGNGGLFYTSDAGATWTQKNNSSVTPFGCKKMKFINDSTGYAITGLFEVYKTSDSGKIWEPLRRDNVFTYLGYSFNDLQYLSGTNELWVGGGHGFLEIGTAGGGSPLPRAFFQIDSGKLQTSALINLINFSRPGYTYGWTKNNSLIGNTYNISYTHNIYQLRDTISLIVSNGIYSDTTTQYINFHPPVILSSFFPVTAASGALITLKGINFSGTGSVLFGGSPAASFTVVADTLITAVVGQGTSGDVTVLTPFGTSHLAGFTFIPTPVISAFTPQSAIAGTQITIHGIHFSGTTEVDFGNTPAQSFVIVSDSVITAIPLSGSSGTVKIITPGGTALLPGFSELPEITAYTPGTGSNGLLVTLTGTGFTNVTAVTFGAVAARAFTVVSSTTLTAIVGSGATGNVGVTTTGGTATLAGFSYVKKPAITNFMPVSGAAGTTVIITGTDFGPTPADNTVYFGVVKASITAASSTSLTVTVPTGTTYAPITVTANHLTASAAQPFVLTFLNGGSITPHSFAPKIDATINTPQSYLTGFALGDIDGDGKPDIAISNEGSHDISIMRNTAGPEAVSYDITNGYVQGFQSNEGAIGYDPQGLLLADVDGDGIKDMLVLSSGIVTIYLNKSTPGNIAFSPPQQVSATIGAQYFSMADFDGDGRQDLIITNSPDNNIYVLLNSSSPGSVSFTAKTNIAIPGSLSLAIGDFDIDGRPDLVVIYKTSNLISVIKNTSTIGNVSVAASVDLTTGYPSGILIADLDGDGMPDLGATNEEGNVFSIFRNTGSNGIISFDKRTDFPTGNAPAGVSISDLDGDGMPDMVITNVTDSTLSVFKNQSRPGNISFPSRTDFTVGTYAEGIILCDMDGDGKNDLVALSQDRATVSTLLNKVLPEPFITSFTPTVGIAGKQITISGNNFTSASAVSFGETAAASFTVNSSTSITAILGDGASGNVSVSNNYGQSTLPGFIYGLTPVITSFSPSSGPIGTVVTITGSNFSPVNTENIVYFGKVMAVVSAATDHSLTVAAPLSATYDPITVTIGRRTGYSERPFIVTFPGAGASFTANSFSTLQQFDGGGSGQIADLDGDGKLDILDIVYVGSGTGLSALRNTSKTGAISFAAPVILPVSPNPIIITLGDLDGDGKPDIVAANQGISVLQNTSTPGTITFGPGTDYATGASVPNPQGVTITDLDGDGRPDVIVCNYSSHTLSVFKNISTGNKIVFDTRIDYAINGYPTDVVFTDLDGDGKQDIALAVNLSPGLMSVFRNTSIPGHISFDTRQDFSTGNEWPTSIKAGDLDGDGKPDLAITNINSNILTVFQNNSTLGTVSFAPKVDQRTGNGPNFLSIGDLDGDGKPDFVTNNIYTPDLYIDNLTISVFKNSSSTGSIALLPTVNYEVVKPSGAGSPGHGAIGDMDGDGKPDIIVFGGNNGLNIFRNQIGESMLPYFQPNTAYTGQVIKIGGSLLTGASAVYFGGIPASSFTVISDTLLLATVGNGASGNVVITLPNDSIVLPGFMYLALPSISSLGQTIFCQGSADTLLSDALYNNQWYKDGVLLNNDTTDRLIVSTGGVYNVTASLNGLTTPPSDSIIITVNPNPVAPTISADSNGLVSSAGSGNQWYIDTLGIIPGANARHYKPADQGYYSLKVSQNGCSSPFSATYYYTIPIVPNSPPPNDSVHVGPNPAGNFITVTFDQTTIRTLDLTISSLNGNLILTQTNVQSGMPIDLSKLARGTYIIKMIGNDGKIKVVNKIIKL